MRTDRTWYHSGFEASWHHGWMGCSLAWTFLSDGVRGWNKARLAHRIVDSFPDTKDSGHAIRSNTGILSNINTWHTNSVDWWRSDLGTGASTVAVRAWAKGNSSWQGDRDRSSSWADRNSGGDSTRLSMSRCCKQSCKWKVSHGSFLHCEVDGDDDL
jgi:hypothetical protein